MRPRSALWAVLFAGMSARAEPAKPAVAIFNVDARDAGLSAGFISTLSEFITVRFTESARFRVVPRKTIREALKKQKVESYKECYDEACQIEVGKELAAQTTVATKIRKIGNLCLVTMTLYNLRKAAADRASSSTGACGEQALLTTVRKAVSSLVSSGAAFKPEMIKIPAGPFFMGCNAKIDRRCHDVEKPGRTAHVKAFHIDKTETTIAQYRACIAAGACRTLGTGHRCNWNLTDRDQLPVNCVDWGQAKAYCKWAGKRLPTEAEWEKAARGTDGRRYPWGNEEFSGRENLANIKDLIQYKDGYSGLAPVGSYPAGASPYGVLDMAGNVTEWTTGKVKKKRVLRGGAWSQYDVFTRASARSLADPLKRYNTAGIRCARSIP